MKNTSRKWYVADHKTGTGKKDKGTGRRLYTDEHPTATVGNKFATLKDDRKTGANGTKVNKRKDRKI